MWHFQWAVLDSIMEDMFAQYSHSLKSMPPFKVNEEFRGCLPSVNLHPSFVFEDKINVI